MKRKALLLGAAGGAILGLSALSEGPRKEAEEPLVEPRAEAPRERPRPLPDFPATIAGPAAASPLPEAPVDWFAEKAIPIPGKDPFVFEKTIHLRYADGRVEERKARIVATPFQKPLRAASRGSGGGGPPKKTQEPR